MDGNLLALQKPHLLDLPASHVGALGYSIKLEIAELLFLHELGGGRGTQGTHRHL